MNQLDDNSLHILEHAVRGNVLTEEEADCSVDLWLNSGEDSSWIDYYIEQGIFSRHYKIRLNMICKGVLPSAQVGTCFLKDGLQTLSSEIKSWLEQKEVFESGESALSDTSKRLSHANDLFDDDFTPTPGMKIENYLLTRNIGMGAAGFVFEAVDMSTNQTVALKIFKKRNKAQGYKTSPLGGQNFIEEAQLLCWLDHKHIVQSLDYINGDICGLVMEYIPGFTLEQLIDQGGRIQVYQCCKILLKVLEALTYIHEHGIIHRDIKPANILLSTEGVVKLADLGIAKITNGLNAAESVKVKQLVGTPYYIAPEQIFSPETADPRSDIYSFGATFYHAITGRTPYIAKNAQQMINMHIAGKLTPPHHICRDIPTSLSDTIVKMMHKVSDDRHESVSEVIQEIEATIAELEAAPFETQRMVIDEIHSKARPDLQKDVESLDTLGMSRYEDDHFKYTISGSGQQQLIKAYKFNTDHSWQGGAAIKEIYIQNNLAHNNILQLKDYQISIHKAQLVYPWEAYDFLGELIQKEFVFFQEGLWEIAQELVSALSFLHRHTISHGNINPYAVVVNSKDIRLFDFSLATDHNSMYFEDVKVRNELEPYFQREPPTLSDNAFAEDIFNLGQLLTACSLSGHVKDMSDAIRYMDISLLENTDRQLDPPYVELLKSLMHEDPKERPSAHKLEEKLI